jgi:hypothetical protein
MIEAPPDYVIESARSLGAHSPCAKSKRGVVLFNPEAAERAAKYGHTTNGVIVSGGFNAPPSPFTCQNNMVCRGSCRDVCLHAEQRAILAALGCDDVRDLELVHVKVVDGQVVAGGGPSCLQCSKLVVGVGIRGVWLFEAQRWHHEIPCGTCEWTTEVAQGAGSDGLCKRCKGEGRLPGLLDFAREKTIYAPDSGVWRFYRSDVFHEATLANNGIASLGAGG